MAKRAGYLTTNPKLKKYTENKLIFNAICMARVTLQQIFSPNSVKIIYSNPAYETNACSKCRWFDTGLDKILLITLFTTFWETVTKSISLYLVHPPLQFFFMIWDKLDRPWSPNSLVFLENFFFLLSFHCWEEFCGRRWPEPQLP